MKTIRIGSGSGYAGDRLDPALELIQKGKLDYICFEGLAERTIALAQKEKLQHSHLGYNSMLLYRMQHVLPLAIQHKVKVITNMGAANPKAAMEAVANLAKDLGISNIKIAAVLGDDISDLIHTYQNNTILETGEKLESIAPQIISANAYIGASGIVEALANNADIIITGRVADPSIFLAPMMFEFGWKPTDADLLGKGTLIGHLLECAGQVSGGYFADGAAKQVPELWKLGFPYVEVDANGNGFISKVAGSGGLINTATCTEQLLYEIHNPEAYITPDCIADFSKVTFQQLKSNTVAFMNGSGKPATTTYKVSVGYKAGYSGEGQISYGGYQCYQRAQLAIHILKERYQMRGINPSTIRFDLIGVNSLNSSAAIPKELNEVRLRVSGKCIDASTAAIIGEEVEALYTNGPAAGGGATKRVDEMIAIASILVAKEDFDVHIAYKTI